MQVIECLDCPYEIIAQDLSSSQLINLTFNTKYTYRIRLEVNNATFCTETLYLDEHGQYILNAQLALNASAESSLQCTLKTQRSANNVYTPLIVAAVVMTALFIVCIVAQRMKLCDQLVKLSNRCFNRTPAPESTHSYDLQACPPATTICQSGIDAMNTVETSPNNAKLPPIHKVSHVIVPRSKRLLSLDAFRGFGKYALLLLLRTSPVGF